MEPVQPTNPQTGPVVSATPAPSPSNSRKGLLIGGGLGLALVLAAVGYFVVAPMMQVSAYKKAAETKAELVKDKLTRTFDSFKLGAFTNANSTVTSDKGDLQVATDAIKAAKTSLDNNEKSLTDFAGWPLLDWNSSYHKAGATKSAEAGYIKQARQFLKDYDALVAYATKSSVLAADFESATKDLDTKIAAATTPAGMAAEIDKAAAATETFVAGQTALAAPDYLADGIKDNIAAANKMVASMKAFSAAVKVLDLKKIESLSTDLDAQIKASDALEATHIAFLQDKSPIAKEITDLKAQADKANFNF